MDDISFERAPVIEIIAELRWLPAPQPRNALTAGINIVTGPEEFFKRFGSEAGKRGFSQSERLIPIDSGYVWQSAAWRFRPIGDLGSLWQVGLGLFSANALQPYSRWTEFRPTVELGVATLLATRPAEEATQPFAVINLRYLNAFSGELLGGKTSATFVRDVLGLKVELPGPLNRLINPATEANLSFAFATPLAAGNRQMAFTIGDGVVNNQMAAVFDITVSQTTAVEPSVEAVMDVLDGSRNLIHGAFVEMTRPIHTLMKPR